MDKKLIWMVKSQKLSNTRKKLSELASREDLFDISEIDTRSKEYLTAVKNYNRAYEKGCEIVTYIDDLYPERLRQIYQPPAVLYVWGNARILKDVVFAGMVGARKCDMYGIRMAENISMEIGQTGAGIASGGALGVDAASHRGALRAKAPTVAVLGSGLDNLYPGDNIPLFEKIVENGGAVISEYPFDMKPLGGNFPQRNRIIAGISSAVVVVRAGHRSGALITATQATNMGLTVFAVPGNIDDALSQGTNELIRDGAVPLLSAVDAIDELIAREPDFFVRERSYQEEAFIRPEKKTEKSVKTKTDTTGLSEYEAEIVNIINSGAQTPNLIEEKVSFEPTRLTALLGMMEIKGIIKKCPDKRYVVTIGGGC